MYYQHGCAAKGEHGYRNRNLSIRSMQRALINIYKTENSYELLVFAPGRIKDNFKLEVKGSQLTISYNPPEGFPRPEWVMREYSRGGFSRTISLNESIDATKITAKYVDGVLEISLPLVPEAEQPKHDIPIS